MIESGQMNKKEEEEKNVNKSKRTLFFFFVFLFKNVLDIKQPNSQWKSSESVNDYLRKFRNYEI
jgi:hypothetical protein